MSGGQPVRTIFPCGDGPTDPRSLVPIGHFQGQKNIQVWNTAEDPELPIEMLVWGGGADEELRVLTLTERSGRAALTTAIREHLLAHPFIDLMGGRERRQRTQKLTADEVKLLGSELGEKLREAGPLPLEPRERARLDGGGRLVLADGKDIALEPARRPLGELALEGPAGTRGDVIELVARPKTPERVVVDLRAAAKDRRGTVRVLDVAERDARGVLVGGSTFVTVAG
jgi:hypothetical protein